MVRRFTWLNRTLTWHRLLNILAILVVFISYSVTPLKESEAIVSSDLHTRSRSPSNTEQEIIRFGQVAEVEFFRALEIEALRAYDQFAGQIQQGIPRKAWAHLSRTAIYSLKTIRELNAMLISFAKQASITYVVSQVVTGLVLPAIFAALEMPGLASFFLTAPVPAFIAAGKVFFTNQYERRVFAKDTGMSMGEIDAFRSELAGFSKKYGVLSILVTDLNETVAKNNSLIIVSEVSQFGEIGISELEYLVKQSTSGSDYLSSIKSSKANKSLYATQLLIFIQNDPALLSTFKNRIVQRASNRRFNESEWFFRASARMMEYQNESKAQEEQIKKGLKAIANQLNREEKTLLKNFAFESSVSLAELNRALGVAEINYLVARKSKVASIDQSEWLVDKLLQDVQARLASNREFLKIINQQGGPKSPEIREFAFIKASLLSKYQIQTPCMNWTLAFSPLM